MRTGLLAGLAMAAFAGAALAATPTTPDMSTLDPAALKALIPADIQWKPAAGLPGTDTAVLVGDPTKPGFYVVLNRFHPGNFSHPHYHPNDRYVMVVSGTWWVATGLKWDPEHVTVPMKAGTFVVHAARHVHYDGARTGSGDAVVMIFGQGPGTRTDCDTEPGPGPCADARAAAAH
jgi:quercetin dioxygenase-like cupin family protein